MRILIDTDYVYSNNLTTEEVLVLLAYYMKVDKAKIMAALKEKGYITQDGSLFNDWRVSEAGVSALNNLIYDSSKEVPKKSNALSEFADKLRAVFPKGYKETGDGKYSWRGTNKEIVDRLRKFYMQYGTKYSEEDILNATKKYVEAHQNSDKMRVLKYFIMKKDLKQGFEVSDLADILENGESLEDSTKDWRTTMV